MTGTTTKRQRHKSTNGDEGGRQGMAWREEPISYGIMEITPLTIWPFMIKQQVGHVAYKLELPSHMKIHNVFHIDLLMPYKETKAYGMPYK